MNDKKNNKDWAKVIRTAIMVAIYFTMFALVIYTDIFRDLFKDKDALRIGFGSIFLVYGLWRGYRLIAELKSK